VVGNSTCETCVVKGLNKSNYFTSNPVTLGHSTRTQETCDLNTFALPSTLMREGS
jgi:hypothetical protein